MLFNRFYQPDFDIESRTVVPALALSTPEEIRVPLLWIALLHGHVKCSLAATTGVHSAVEVIKYLMAGGECGDEHLRAAAARSVRGSPA